MIAPRKASEPTENLCTLSPERLQSILAAGALDAIRENQRFGLPVLTTRDGQLERIDAFEAEAELLKNFPELANKGPSSSTPTP